MFQLSVRDINGLHMYNKPFLRNFIKFDMNSETAYSQVCICTICNATLTKDDIQYNLDTAN
jgi:hypothetical protein